MLKKYNIMDLVAAACTLLGMGAANAAVTITFTEVGTSVVAVGEGTLSLRPEEYIGTDFTDSGFVEPEFGYVGLGGGGGFWVYVVDGGVMLGPSSFGGGGFREADFSDGDSFGILLDSEIYVPVGYESGNPLSGSARWDNSSFSSLGLTPGTYTYTWGTGENADSLTVQIGAIPEPSSALLCVLGCLAFLRRLRG